MPFRLRSTAAVVAALASPLCAGQWIPTSTSNLAEMSLEELGNLRVTTAALRPERFYDVPASIFVITNEEIRRSGAASLPEALRLAPNLEVSQVSATTWAISARGFQNVITNKLLVLIDGRTLYTTVLSGVLWDAQDVMLEDVERIEVISGPGAALYGANAFVGVINVITRTAGDSQGAVVVAGAGKVNRDASLRYGGRIGETGAYRAYVMHIERDNLRPAASHVVDDMKKEQAGFRVDLGSVKTGLTTLQGDAYQATVSGNGAPDLKLSGSNLLARWSRETPGGSFFKLQAYYDHTDRNDPTTFIDRVDTVDIEAQHDLPAWGAHRISYGAGYRYANDDTTPNAIIRFIPEDRRLHWGTVFAQDQWDLGSNVTLTLGGKVQSTVYVKPEFMPDVRLDWKASASQLVWVSGSRVARTPGRIDRDFNFPGNPPFFIKGNTTFQSETGKVTEIGYRAQPLTSLSFSVSAFHARLDDLRGGTAAPGGGSMVSNQMEGTTRGIEAWAIWEPFEQWRLTAGLLELRQDLRAKDGGGAGAGDLGNDPRHTLKLRSAYRVTADIDFDVSWRYVSALSYLRTVPGYQATDVRIAWRAMKNLELALVGRNVFDPRHVEFDEHGFAAVIPRAAYIQARLAF